MFLWAIAAVPFGIYTIAQYLNIPLQLQPQLFLLLALITWGQCMYYDRHWSLKKCLSVIVSLCIVFGGIEVGVIFGIRVFILVAMELKGIRFRLIMGLIGLRRFLGLLGWCLLRRDWFRRILISTR